MGQYGFLRNQMAVQYSSDRARFRVSHVYQENGGYRAQEFNHKQQVTLSGFWAASDTVSYRIYATNYSGRWGLPGGISLDDARENPRQARAFAEANGTRVERTRARVGLARIWNTGKWRNTTSVYANTTNKINPYGTSAFFNGYKDEQAQGWGARSVLTRSYDSVGSRTGWLEISLGGEFQLEDNLLNEWELVNSNPGDFKYLNETRSTAWTTFLQAQYDDGPMELSAGISLNQTVYDNTGESQQPDTLISLQQRFDPGVMVLPRVSMRLQTGSWQWHAQGSLGASAPSLFEMVNPEDGTFAPELTAERSLNGEVGVVRNSASMLGEVNRPLGLTAYWTRLQDAILPANEVLFTNGGEIDLRGLEAFAEAITGYEGQSWRVHGRTVAALQTYTFVTFNEGDVSFKDKYVPGLPQFTWTNQVSLRYNLNANAYNGVMNLFELTATHRWNDRTPVNNENETWAPAWNTVNVQLRYHRNWKRWDFSAHTAYSTYRHVVLQLLAGERLWWTLLQPSSRSYGLWWIGDSLHLVGVSTLDPDLNACLQSTGFLAFEHCVSQQPIPAISTKQTGQTPVITNSVRRLRARPRSVSLESTGWVSPRPRAWRRPASMPLFTRYSTTAFARFSLSTWLSAVLPTWSV